MLKGSRQDHWAGRGWQPPVCPVGGPAHGLSPEKLHFWAECELRSVRLGCREAVGICGASGRASWLLCLQVWVWVVRASPLKHFQLKSKQFWDVGMGNSPKAVPGVGGNGRVGQGCPQDCCEADGARDPKRCFEHLVLSAGYLMEPEPVRLSDVRGKAPGCGAEGCQRRPVRRYGVFSSCACGEGSAKDIGQC